MADPQGKRDVGKVIGLVVAGLCVPAIAIALGARSCNSPAARGRVAVIGDTGGDWSTTVLQCWLATPGVNDDILLGRKRAEPIVHLTIDPTRLVPIVEIDRPSENRTIRVDGERCKLDLRPAHGKPGDADFDLRGGSLAGKCTLSSGARVELDLWWRSCKAE